MHKNIVKQIAVSTAAVSAAHAPTPTSASQFNRVLPAGPGPKALRCMLLNPRLAKFYRHSIQPLRRMSYVDKFIGQWNQLAALHCPSRGGSTNTEYVLADDATIDKVVETLRTAYVATKPKRIPKLTSASSELKEILVEVKLSRDQAQAINGSSRTAALTPQAHWDILARMTACMVAINTPVEGTEPCRYAGKVPDDTLICYVYKLNDGNKEYFDQFQKFFRLQSSIGVSLEGLRESQLRDFYVKFCRDVYGLNSVMIFQKTLQTVNGRECLSPHHYFPPPEHTEILDAFEDDQCAVLLGDSGVGKTYLMMHAAGMEAPATVPTTKEDADAATADPKTMSAEEAKVGLRKKYLKNPLCFFLHAESLTNFDSEQFPKLPDRTVRDDDEFRKIREAWIAKRIIKRLRDYVEARAGTDDPTTSWKLFLEVLCSKTFGISFTICIDEAGREKDVVAAMTQMKNATLHKYLLEECEALSVNLPLRCTDEDENALISKDLKFHYVVAGTGIPMSQLPPGSLPGTYTIINVDPKESEQFVKNLLVNGMRIEKSGDIVRWSTPHAIAQVQLVLLSSDVNLEILQNCRLAVLAVEHALRDKEVIESILENSQAINPYDCKIPLGFATKWVHSAALKFKKLNGLSEIRTPALPTIMSLTLRAFYFPEHHGISKEMMELLTVKYGMLLENGRWFEKGKQPENWKIIREQGMCAFCRHDDDSKYRLPPRNVAILSLLAWGELPLETTHTGLGLESAMQYASMLLVMACRRKSELLYLLEHTKPTEQLFSDDEVYPKGVMKVRCFGVDSTKIENARTLSKGDCCVILSKNKDSFADVVIIFGDLIVLIQCKDYESDGVLNAMETALEMYKMGSRTPASIAAKLANLAAPGSVASNFVKRRKKGDNIDRIAIFSTVRDHLQKNKNLLRDISTKHIAVSKQFHGKEKMSAEEKKQEIQGFSSAWNAFERPRANSKTKVHTKEKIFIPCKLPYKKITFFGNVAEWLDGHLNVRLESYFQQLAKETMNANSVETRKVLVYRAVNRKISPSNETAPSNRGRDSRQISSVSSVTTDETYIQFVFNEQMKPFCWLARAHKTVEKALLVTSETELIPSKK